MLRNWLIMNYLKPILNIGFLLILNLVFSTSINAQTQDKVNEIRTIDMRGQSPVKASVVALKASRNDVIVVLINGGDKELIDKTKSKLKALSHQGYNRIGVVLGNLQEGSKGSILAVVSDGTLYAAINEAKSDTTTMWKIYNLVRDAYQDNILSKTNKDIQCDLGR